MLRDESAKYYLTNINNNLETYPERLAKKNEDIVWCGSEYVLKRLMKKSINGSRKVVIQHQKLLSHLRTFFKKDITILTLELIYKNLSTKFNIKVVEGVLSDTFVYNYMCQRLS